MADSNATRPTSQRREPKAKKPETKFDLTFHKPSGQYRKRIRGRDFYFGKDKDAALAEWLRVKPFRMKGQEPPPKEPLPPEVDDRSTLKDLANVFLTHKKSQVEIGELTVASFNDYLKTCERLLKALGKNTFVETVTPEDLLEYRRKLATTLGPTALGNEVTRVRVVFNFAFSNALIEKPIRYGEFKKPRKPATRRVRQSKGSKLFDPLDLRTIIDAADIQLKAMILLGINAAFGNADCGTLPIKAVDLDGGWLDFPRQKTGIDRRCKLWPETVSAIREYLPTRKAPTNDKNAGLLFVTKYSAPWYVDGASGSPISAEFRKLLDREGLYREGLSFYALRHTFQTIGDDAGDYLAVRRIMGHADNSISDHYRERFSDDRLIAVVDHVRGWLFGSDNVKS